jgi:hypothetical protein
MAECNAQHNCWFDAAEQYAPYQAAVSAFLTCALSGAIEGCSALRPYGRSTQGACVPPSTPSARPVAPSPRTSPSGENGGDQATGALVALAIAVAIAWLWWRQTRGSG